MNKELVGYIFCIVLSVLMFVFFPDFYPNNFSSMGISDHQPGFYLDTIYFAVMVFIFGFGACGMVMYIFRKKQIVEEDAILKVDR